jgi:hypothetical protein
MVGKTKKMILASVSFIVDTPLIFIAIIAMVKPTTFSFAAKPFNVDFKNVIHAVITSFANILPLTITT